MEDVETGDGKLVMVGRFTTPPDPVDEIVDVGPELDLMLLVVIGGSEVVREVFVD